MQYLSLGMLAPGRSEVLVEAWSLDESGNGWETLVPVRIHFQYRGMEEAIADYITREQKPAGPVNALRFTESASKTLGTWTRDGGYRDLEHG
ncbi:hypothetical protein SEA_ZOOMAN_289 [Microbacterium phage Zooman]|nr:hypothetical protein SEA_ZOOMAN_289 [Microbacterium phage Zooman]